MWEGGWEREGKLAESTQKKIFFWEKIKIKMKRLQRLLGEVLWNKSLPLYIANDGTAPTCLLLKSWSSNALQLIGALGLNRKANFIYMTISGHATALLRLRRTQHCTRRPSLDHPAPLVSYLLALPRFSTTISESFLENCERLRYSNSTAGALGRTVGRPVWSNPHFHSKIGNYQSEKIYN